MSSDNKFKIVQKLDAGGMAEVYKGIQTSVQGIEKLVAIKRILPHLTKNQKFVDMFLDEARVSMHLSHANIVQVFDLGQSTETFFIVMEYIDGTNLKNIADYFKAQGRTMPVEQAVYIATEICKGLAYAHDLRNPVTGKPLNIVHRDISPPNVLISRGGEIKIVDFGLAKAASQVTKTDQGVVKGKFSYLSPEAAMGEEVDRRADIFAVGIVLWELLAGKRLFYGETDFHTVELVRKAQVPSLTALNPHVSPELEEIIRTALARNINSRYQTARDFGDALSQHLFTRGLKVTSYDIQRLVEEVLADRAAKAVREEPSLIHELIQEELLKFSSIGDEKNNQALEKGGAGGPSESLIDTREWDLISMDSSSTGLAAVSTPEEQQGAVELGNLASISSPNWGNAAELYADRPLAPTPAPSAGGPNRALLLVAALVLFLLGGAGVYAYLNGLIGGSSSSVAASTASPESP